MFSGHKNGFVRLLSISVRWNLLDFQYCETNRGLEIRLDLKHQSHFDDYM